jgi:hypothetical protein
MDELTLLAAIFGVFLGALSLGWRMASHAVLASKVTAELRIGAMAAEGSTLISGPLRSMTASAMARMAEMGFTRPVVAINIRNVGRVPATVMHWSLVDQSGNSLTPDTDAIGLPMPFQLQAGESQIWAVDAEAVRVMACATAVTLFDMSSSIEMFGRVELAGGRLVDTKAKLRLHNKILRAVGQ